VLGFKSTSPCPTRGSGTPSRAALTSQDPENAHVKILPSEQGGQNESELPSRGGPCTVGPRVLQGPADLKTTDWTGGSRAGRGRVAGGAARAANGHHYGLVQSKTATKALAGTRGEGGERAVLYRTIPPE
jgi:hypothetical protein